MRWNEKSVWVGLAALCLSVAVASAASEVSTSSPSVAEAQPDSAAFAVYGTSAQHFLPSAEEMREKVNPKANIPSSHAKLEFPDEFYLIFGPIFLIVFLRLMVIWLRALEQEHGDDQMQSYY